MDLLVGIVGFLALIQADVSIKFLILMGFWWIFDVILREGQNDLLLFGRFIQIPVSSSNESYRTFLVVLYSRHDVLNHVMLASHFDMG